MKTLIFLLIANLVLAQSLTPQFGIHWTGGMTYDNDHEAPSAQVGLIYTPKMKIQQDTRIYLLALILTWVICSKKRLQKFIINKQITTFVF